MTRARLGLGLLLATLAAAPALAGGPPATTILSGQTWRSGSTKGGGSDCLGPFRNRLLDVGVNYVVHSSFAAMVKQTTPGGTFAASANKMPLWVVTLPLLADDTAGQFAQCAAGTFDSWWQAIGANLNAVRPQGTVVRLGIEANGGWGTPGWSRPAKPRTTSPAGGAPPGSQVGRARPQPRVDEREEDAQHGAARAALVPGRPGRPVPGRRRGRPVGRALLRQRPAHEHAGAVGSAYTRTFNGGPWGLGTWLQATQQHGKKLAVSEWGVWQQSGQAAAAADDPVYVDNMFRFFGTNAVDVAYESYFNKVSVHQLCPSTLFPNAAAKYQTDWGLGAAAARSGASR